MLIIGRKKEQKILIDGNIEITVLEIGRNRVRFGIQAPKTVKIHTKKEGQLDHRGTTQKLVHIPPTDRRGQGGVRNNQDGGA